MATTLEHSPGMPGLPPDYDELLSLQVSTEDLRIQGSASEEFSRLHCHKTLSMTTD